MYMNVYIYICVCVYIYIYMYVYMCVRVRACVRACVCVIYVQMHLFAGKYVLEHHDFTAMLTNLLTKLFGNTHLMFIKVVLKRCM